MSDQKPIKAEILPQSQIRAKGYKMAETQAANERISNNVEYLKVCLAAAAGFVSKVEDEIFDDTRKGVFIFHHDKRFAVAEVWITADQKILEVYRNTKDIKEVTPEYAFKIYGLARFSQAIGKAFDDIASNNETIYPGNVGGKILAERMLNGDQTA